MEPQRPLRLAKEESDILKGLSNQIIGCAIKVHTIKNIWLIRVYLRLIIRPHPPMELLLFMNFLNANRV